MSSDYFILQANHYFDSLDTTATNRAHPRLSEDVIRWEWYPWLKLTACGKSSMTADKMLLLFPTEVHRDEFKVFATPPQCRCRVTFDYKWQKEPVRIYQEFTFNQSGEMAFIEAWSDEPGHRPTEDSNDRWAEGENARRLSQKFLSFDPEYGHTEDEDLKDLLRRMKHPLSSWIVEASRFGCEYVAHQIPYLSRD